MVEEDEDADEHHQDAAGDGDRGEVPVQLLEDRRDLAQSRAGDKERDAEAGRVEGEQDGGLAGGAPSVQ